jgi:hypothetical protein
MATYLRGSPSEMSLCNHMLRYANVLIVQRIFAYSTWKDRLFLCISVIAAIGAGSAFPIMTIVFGK